MGIQSLPPNAGTARIKKRIRDLERLLAKPGLAATKKTEAERAVAAFRGELDAARHRQTETRNAKKYHLVRFVERKKALRQLRKAGAGAAELAAWYYVALFPKDRKYRALYAGAEPATRASHPFLDDVHRRMDAGELATGEAAVKAVLEENRALLN